MRAPELKSYSNLSSDEKTALATLKRNHRVVIREADKGSAVVIMDRERYISEAMRQLGDSTVHTRTSTSAWRNNNWRWRPFSF
jgi:hypothetical protein